MIRTIVADKTTAIFAAQAVTATLFARERTGEGQHIRLAMLDTMIAYLWPEAMTQYTVVGREATTADPTARPELIFETADGYITVGTISDSEWRGFCAASEQSDLAADPRFGTPGGRADKSIVRLDTPCPPLSPPPPASGDPLGKDPTPPPYPRGCPQSPRPFPPSPPRPPPRRRAWPKTRGIPAIRLASCSPIRATAG